MSFLDHDLLRLIVSQSKTTLDMRQILDEGKILLVSLSPQYQDASSLIGATLISQLLSAMYARGPTPENAIGRAPSIVTNTPPTPLKILPRFVPKLGSFAF